MSLPLKSNNLSRGLFNLLVVVTTGAIIYALYLSFVSAPAEKVMGAVQRIFYFHVGSAIASYIAFLAVLIGSLGVLLSGEKKFDMLQQASSEVSFVMCSVVLSSGMIWGHSAWNTWFRFEPRLVSFLLLWCIALSLVVIRLVADPKKVPTHAAIIGILGAVMVPVVVYSIEFLKGVPQLHPQVVEHGGLKDLRYKYALTASIVALSLLTILLIFVRARIESLRYSFSTR